MTEHNDSRVEQTSIAMSPGVSMRVYFMPRRDTSLRSFLYGLLFLWVYLTAATILYLYTRLHMHGMWFLVASLGQLVLHFYMTTEILKSSDEVERLIGYGLVREEGVMRFCGYAPRRRRLRTLGLPIRSVEEVSSRVLVHLSDGSQIQLPKLSLEGQRLFQSVFEAMCGGANAKTLREQYTSLAPGLIFTLEYKDAPQLPKWQYWASVSLGVPCIYAGSKLFELLFQ
ncbi:hypothetical protein J2W23_003807 [Variovorax boronicumulans]|uniref:hypothetical protein n=1 Tax=Variovorax boronicumulans TaxID=436515 RepID=UPI0027879A8B|nr:hypothetical protein [Variovorax boronicumulans]MDQ0015407.1 hypothetical protein [Variovorax boronicumulans]